MFKSLKIMEKILLLGNVNDLFILTIQYLLLFEYGKHISFK